MEQYVIIGGVAGGASAAARLRRLKENAKIIIVERGSYISFANCGLPYYIGREIKDREELILQTPESLYQRFRIDVRINQEATCIDTQKKLIKIRNLQTGEVYEESYDKLILSPGAEPIKPNMEGTDLDCVFSLRTIPDMDEIMDAIATKRAKEIVIVGGGYIGIELADNLYKAGLQVTIVEFADHVIAPLDYDMACEVHNHIREKGVRLILKNGVKKIESKENRLLVSLSDKTIMTDIVILAVGVRPESKLAKEAGLQVSERGAILVDEHLKTSDPHIYAVGDAIQIKEYVTKEAGFIPLAGPANKQGRIAADHIAGIDRAYNGTQGTGILKCFDFVIATTGINEARAKASGIEYEKSYTYSASHAAYYPNASMMSIKIIFEKKSGRLLGAQVIGVDGADKRADVFATAIRGNMTVYDLAELELSYAPPFSSAKDPVNMAGFAAENILEKRVKVIHWDEIRELPKDGRSQCIDVRTRMEYYRGTIEGFSNMPLDQLREEMGTLNKDKPVYVTCQIGLRGYLACRILEQHGYECYNLSGGYRLYQSIYEAENMQYVEENDRAELKAASLKEEENFS